MCCSALGTHRRIPHARIIWKNNYRVSIAYDSLARLRNRHVRRIVKSRARGRTIIHMGVKNSWLHTRYVI